MDNSADNPLERWLAPFAKLLRHKTRARMLAAYIGGLLAHDGRKTVQMLAASLPDVTYDQLHHFLTSPAWDTAPLSNALLAHAASFNDGAGTGWLTATETCFVKKGEHSVGVAPQFAAGLGRNANCQTMLGLHLAQGGLSLPLAMQLYLPPAWTSEPARLQQAGVPPANQPPRDRANMVLDQIDSLTHSAFNQNGNQIGQRCSGVLLDGSFALAPRLRRGLAERNLPWAALLPDHAGEGDTEPTPVFTSGPIGSASHSSHASQPPSSRSRTRITPANAAWLLANAQWQSISWRHADHSRQTARFAAIRVAMADPADQAGAKDPADAAGHVWLMGEKPALGDTRYYLSNLPASANLRQLAAPLKARDLAARSQQIMRDKLGLEQFEGRSWAGLHRHCLMVMIAAHYHLAGQTPPA